MHCCKGITVCIVTDVGWCWGHYWFVCLWWKPSMQVECQSAQEIWRSQYTVMWIVYQACCWVL